jgi:predicted homoserine dehydrogenase-like protein
VDVLTIAKKDLAAGDRLDDFGGFTFHGSLDTAQEAGKLDALPVGLAPGARVTRSVRRGTVITWKDVQLDESKTVVKLRRQQDAQ